MILINCLQESAQPTEAAVKTKVILLIFIFFMKNQKYMQVAVESRMESSVHPADIAVKPTEITAKSKVIINYFIKGSLSILLLYLGQS